MTALPTQLLVALEQIARTQQLLVALDFDGTLAPTVDDPERARALPAAQEAMERLIPLERTRVALVSGRALDSLERVTDAGPSVLMAGSHGAEFRFDSSGRAAAHLDDGQRADRERLHDVLSRIAASVEGAWIEEKPVGFALHTRLVNPDGARRAQSAALAEATAVIPELTVREGKDVLEFSVLAATKGHAIARLREHCAASAVVFVGDDVTDEDGFAVLGPDDVGVKVGAGATRARFRVDTTDSVPLLLSILADARRDAVRFVP